MLDRDELAAWLRLTETPGIGLETARRLLAAFGSPQAVFEAPQRAWRELLGPAQTAALNAPAATLDALVESTWQWLQAGEATAPRQVVVLGDVHYPALLLETADPPLLLYAMGRTELLCAPAVAVVGSRNPSAQGLENARAFAAVLSGTGLTVVSGLALGIDGAAHEGALQGPGSTIAVVGTGLDRVYPKRHFALAHRIATAGLVLSEYSLGTPPVAANFPRRNRLIAGLARGTLVVEAALKSGSLITARLALDAGREVFAIPGSIHAPQSRGCHALIKQGAKLVEAAADVLVELRLDAPPRPPAAAVAFSDSGGDPVLTALGHDPVTLDALAARTGWSPAQLSAHLLELELAGEVSRLPGQLFQRLIRA
ncbi:MAG: DNA-protecting protein DprA [Methylibium sp.]|uniref:DNA-processing protein DprA n=1 Tax=Methylibium sp. TaxID=2067992 RepID=UPI0017A67B94|nr:DNA-processing protein DprA [Methylibium sp.]MBA3597977.1 DNA-protecting protein DprA [Methylibium sp.]